MEEAKAQLKEDLVKALEEKTVKELKALCKRHGVKRYSGLRKPELIQQVSDAKLDQIPDGPPKERAAAVDKAVKTDWIDRHANKNTFIGVILGVIGVFLGVIGFSPFGRELVTTVFQQDDAKPFEEIEGSYNILILPFAPLQNCKTVDTHMEEAVKSRLLEMSQQDTLDLQVKLYKGTKCPRDYDAGRKIGAEFNADLVVWGDLYDVCSTELEACVKYAVVKQVRGVEMEGKSPTESLKLWQIQEGKLQGGIDFIIY